MKRVSRSGTSSPRLRKTVIETCVCVLIMPGITMPPRASMTLGAVKFCAMARGPTATMRASLMTTAPPSKISLRSFIVTTSPLITMRSAGCCARRSAGSAANASRRSGLATARMSEFRRARRAGERDHVADVGDAGHEHEHSLETESEAGVRHGAVAAQVEIPPVFLLAELVLRHVFAEH